MRKEERRMIKDFERVTERYGGSLDDLRKLQIVHALFNKFGTGMELANYLDSKGVEVDY